MFHESLVLRQDVRICAERSFAFVSNKGDFVIIVIYTSLFFLFYSSTALVGLDLLIAEVSRSHSDSPHSIGILWTNDRSVADTST